MGTPFSGRTVYAYIGGNALVNNKGFNATLNNSVGQIDPDISTTWLTGYNGFHSVTGTLNFNLNTDDFGTLWDAVVTGTAVSLYLYGSRSSGADYVYGSAFLGDIGMTSEVGSTASGTLAFTSTGTWGRQNLA